MDDVANQRIGSLSKGYKQRVGLADALVADPPVLILDEPTSGLDPNQIRDVRDVVRALAGDHTVLLSTHILGEVEAVCDDVVVIHRGRLVAEGTREEIKRKGRPAAIEVVARGDEERCLGAARAIEGFDEVTITEAGDALRLRCTWGTPSTDEARATVVEALVGALVASGAHVRRVAEETSSLEDVFAELTRASRRAEEREDRS